MRRKRTTVGRKGEGVMGVMRGDDDGVKHYYYCLVTNLSPGMQCFGLKQLVPLCFRGFGSNRAHLGQKKAVFGRNRVCKKWIFLKNTIFKLVKIAPKVPFWVNNNVRK